MKLNIEIWIEKNILNDSVNKLFKESIICYKAGAYRASLLFSYLAYMSIIKNRLLSSKLPNGITQTLWDKILLNLQNEEKWDKESFESTQRKNPSPIFNIPESLRREIVYWKDKRNECAHFRNVIVSSHHIDTFWDFTITTIPKITVIGGKKSLLQKFYKHFDISLTPKGLDYKQLINEIEYSVDENELGDFYLSITQELQGDFFEKSTYIEIFESIFSVYDNVISDKLVQFLKTKSNILIEFLRENPRYIEGFKLKPEGVRKLWFKYLFKASNNDFPLYTALIKSKLIPETEYSEAHNKIIPRIGKYELNSAQVSVLEESKFFETFHDNHVYHKEYFKNETANNYSGIIVEYIKLHGITEKLALSLSKTLNKSSPPYSLEKKIKELFFMETKYQEDFIKLCETKKLEIPSNIITIDNETLK